MPRQKRPTGDKRPSAYQIKLAAVRRFVAGFDAKALDDLYTRQPRTVSGKAARSAKLRQVSRTYNKLKPYLQRSYVRVKPRNAEHVAKIAEYANVPKLKGLRAVPVATEFPKKFKVSVNRQGEVTATRGKRYKEIVYKFPRKPRAHVTKAGKFITAGEHAIAMTEEMVKSMNPGFYVPMTNLHDVIQFGTDRESLVQTMRSFVFAYEKNSATWMPYLRGFRYLAHTAEAAQKRVKGIQEIRVEARNNRRSVQQKWNAKLKAETEFKRRMAERKRIKAEGDARKLGKVSKRARATGRR